jgi:RNA polymerase sigma factor (sigma-70 family)
VEASALTHSQSLPGLRGPSPLLRLQADEKLIALTRRGQHAAFEVLFSRYQSRLLSFCRHMLSSREDAEDVLQEVFTAAFNAVLADEREINVRPWLYRIARNRSLNHLRRASAIGVDSMDTHFADHGLSTGDRVIRRESFRQLLTDVQQLPETQRTALLLREIDALSYEQIAHAMETTVPSVKSLLVRARISLAEAAEARKLSCAEVRLELGEVAEGLSKLGAPARRHVRDCSNCRSFRKHLKDNNHALAAMLPVGPLLLIKKLLLTKLGSTASAGGAHVAGGAGATVGASAGAGAGVAATAGAAGGTSAAGSIFTLGASALATKAVAGLAAAAIVTAGAVAADHVSHLVRHHHPAATAATYMPATASASEPVVVVRNRPQPISNSSRAYKPSGGAAIARHRARRHPAKPPSPTTVVLPASSTVHVNPVVATMKPATTPQPPAATQVTEVTTETAQLPVAATSEAQPTTPSTPATTTATATTSSETPPSSPSQPSATEPEHPTTTPTTPPTGAPESTTPTPTTPQQETPPPPAPGETPGTPGG